MKKILSYLFVLSLTFLIGFGFDSIHPNTTAKNEVLQLIDEFHDAHVNFDEAKLKLILANKIKSKVRDGNFETVSSKKVIEFVKEIELSSIWTGLYRTEKRQDEITVHFYMGAKFRSQNKDSFDHWGSYTYSFEKQGSEWKLVSIHFKG